MMGWNMLERFDMQTIGAQLDAQGYALLPQCLGAREIHALIAALDDKNSTIGADGEELCYFGQEMPPRLHAWYEALYRWLVPVANRWNELAGIERRFPDELNTFLELNGHASQNRPQSHLYRLREGERRALHRHDEGEWIFPLQIVALMSEPQREFTGGEFVMTEQRPRMQSRPMVVPLAFGDMAIIASAQRPVQGTHGYYRASLKHAVSRVRSGERIGLELIFHQAA